MRPARVVATIFACFLVLLMGVGLWALVSYLSLTPSPLTSPSTTEADYGHADGAPARPDQPLVAGGAVPAERILDDESLEPVETAAEGSPAADYIVDPDWTDEMAQRTGIPARVMQAYASAALWAHDTHPACGVEWNTLAGVGLVESQHGWLRGASVRANGDVRPEIIGLPLDGSGGTALVPDTDGGRLDGDTEFDRAVGPMQFIPETWELFSVDARGTGEADPHNIDDAVFSAANYFCSMGVDFASDEGWTRGILRYNASQQYADDVYAAAQYYADA